LAGLEASKLWIAASSVQTRTTRPAEPPPLTATLQDGVSYSSHVYVLQQNNRLAPNTYQHLEGDFAKFWLLDAYEFAEEIPKTAIDKFLKLELHERLKEYVVSKG